VKDERHPERGPDRVERHDQCAATRRDALQRGEETGVPDEHAGEPERRHRGEAAPIQTRETVFEHAHEHEQDRDGHRDAQRTGGEGRQERRNRAPGDELAAPAGGHEDEPEVEPGRRAGARAPHAFRPFVCASSPRRSAT
jgi:hypothetical protein